MPPALTVNSLGPRSAYRAASYSSRQLSQLLTLQSPLGHAVCRREGIHHTPTTGSRATRTQANSPQIDTCEHLCHLYYTVVFSEPIPTTTSSRTWLLQLSTIISLSLSIGLHLSAQTPALEQPRLQHTSRQYPPIATTPFLCFLLPLILLLSTPISSSSILSPVTHSRNHYSRGTEEESES